MLSAEVNETVRVLVIKDKRTGDNNHLIIRER